ncbi:thiamine pyrophosphokinase [Niveomyces insectorum RCEF 264]|uniref:Thiamine pyrophosphokinase n=1 Tax=Niveomyces insectorum RCEF 264 TaxID=1081102 RepID=A0A167ZVC8_9HYPO|nr:thiamine pyrophosphokinase [Niveomyces insectorum RCEF 264]
MSSYPDDNGNEDDDAVFEWYPARFLQDRPAAPARPYAVIVLNQPLSCLRAIKRLWARASYRVAADGGANRLYDARAAAGESFSDLDVIVGDLDSLRDETRAYFAQGGAPRATAVVHDPDQYSTDFGKAVRLVDRQRPGLHIVALGGLGGRVDQGVSQLHHLHVLQRPAADDENGGNDDKRVQPTRTRHLYLLSSESLTWLLPPGRHRIHVREAATTAAADKAEAENPTNHDDVDDDDDNTVFAKYVGILPLQGPSVITTRGLEWDVAAWPTQMGAQLSTSNHVLPTTRTVEVETSAAVVFTIALREP